jgi:hypothetical protein
MSHVLVDPSEVTEFAELVDRWVDEEGSARAARLNLPDGYPGASFYVDPAPINSFLESHPHLLLAAGFPEVAVRRNPYGGGLDNVGLWVKAPEMSDHFSASDWLLIGGVEDVGSADWTHGNLEAPEPVIFATLRGRHRSIAIDDVIEDLHMLTETPDVADGKITWGDELGPGTLGNVELSRISCLAEGLVHALWSDAMSFRDLSWDHLEDVVAELARGLGLEVAQTRRSGDGGRDVIVRGELLPGIPATAAIEVTSSRRVRRDKVSRALWDNRHYPLTLVVTSGTFSAGVLSERDSVENAMRLHLGEEMMLHDWVGRYADAKGWPRPSDDS